MVRDDMHEPPKSAASKLGKVALALVVFFSVPAVAAFNSDSVKRAPNAKRDDGAAGGAVR
jgi:hypothetical protein